MKPIAQRSQSGPIAKALSAYLAELRVQSGRVERLLYQALKSVDLAREKRAMNFVCSPPEIMKIIAGHVRRLVCELGIEPNTFRFSSGIIPECKEFYCLQQDERPVSIVDTESLDVALLWFPFHDQKRSARVFNEIWRVLKPGGKVVVIQENAYAPHADVDIMRNESGPQQYINLAPRIESFHPYDKRTGEILVTAGFHDVSKTELQITEREICEILFLKTIDSLKLDRPNTPRLAWAFESLAKTAFYAKAACASNSERLVLIEAIRPQVCSIEAS